MTDPVGQPPHIADPAHRQHLRQQIEDELLGNILPFWIAKTPDVENGGFYGALTNDLRVLNDTPRSAVLIARILWTFSAAYRAFGRADDLAMARRAYEYLTGPVWDPVYGGVYWLVDKQAAPVNSRKHTYAQAFAIYGLAEYYAATGDGESLCRAQELFGLLEAHAHDDVNGGYREGRLRDWCGSEDMRLSGDEPNTTKSMNTLLHAMEAFANLARVWDDAHLRLRLRELITGFLDHVIDPHTHHFRLFFDDDWRAHGDTVSFGHDIEGSWLLVEAAEVLGDAGLLQQARQRAVRMAQAVYTDGLDPADNSVLYETAPGNRHRFDKHWWVEAEGMVGFYNAFEISGDARYAQEAFDLWDFIAAKFVDHGHGDWFKVLDRQGVPYADCFKVGPWECPYHHSRACLEMLRRLA